MIEDSPKQFDQPSEPIHISEPLAQLDDVMAAGSDPKTEEQIREQDLQAELDEAERVLSLIEARTQAGEEAEDDPRLKDEMTIQAITARNQLKSRQNDLP